MLAKIQEMKARIIRTSARIIRMTLGLGLLTRDEPIKQYPV
jgi:hypothetical protein